MSAARIAPPPKAAPAGVKAYYAGAVRVVIDGVPTRVARRPSRNMLVLMTEPRDYSGGEGCCPFTARPLYGYAACGCGHCGGSAIVLPKRDLQKLRRKIGRVSP